MNNFDKLIDRHNTQAIKVDGMNTLFGREDLIPLWVADMDFEVCPEITKALKLRLAHHIYGYSCPKPSYWQSIIDWESYKHNFDFTREEISYVPGVVKGIALAINYYTNEGDKIVIQPPVYHPFKMVAEGNSRIVVNNPLINNNGSYSMDLDGLEKIFKEENPKMIILCNPHNPIGITWNRETLTSLASLCKRYDVIVLSDEIHGDLALFGNEHIPFATVSVEAADMCVTFGAPSKTFNIPGLVSSWCVIKNSKLRKGFFEWLSNNEFNDPTLIATTATEAAYTKGDGWLAEAKSYIEGNIIWVEDYCKKYIPQIKVIRPEASFLLWLDCKALNLSHSGLINLFVNHAHLALNDGEMFGTEGTGYMRLNVGTSRQVLELALDALKIAILNK